MKTKKPITVAPGTEPYFAHDCPVCLFIGHGRRKVYDYGDSETYNDPPQEYYSKTDRYYCPAGAPGGGSLIERNSSYPSDYFSTPAELAIFSETGLELLIQAKDRRVLKISITPTKTEEY